MTLIERVYAGVAVPVIEPKGTDTTTNLLTLLTGILNAIVLFVGAIAVIYLVYSGILYITAAGNPDAAKKGQQGIVNAIIGIIVVVLAYMIVAAVQNTAKTQIK